MAIGLIIDTFKKLQAILPNQVNFASNQIDCQIEALSSLVLVCEIKIPILKNGLFVLLDPLGLNPQFLAECFGTLLIFRAQLIEFLQ